MDNSSADHLVKIVLLSADALEWTRDIPPNVIHVIFMFFSKKNMEAKSIKVID